ncbi:alpha/beta family hydrolase [Hyphomicrobium sp.]|uniref:alpha/beta fold hydrolase n=1 Tax=Hyphomicrobium sp. TaxID=82 RepID=UPI000FAFFC1D|nr:alpha/beta family hydrolase [Hyphomicrobium sp.]RUO99558.1 MAG: alpha/beta hydrolase [Hyphomicrobium sp.]
MTPVQNRSGPKPAPPSTFMIERGPSDTVTRLILAHGAGAGISSSFFDAITALLAERQIALTLFEFAYMAGRRTGGSKRPPPRAEALVDEYRAAVAEVAKAHPDQTLVIGGKSLGGRVASLVADSLFSEGAIAGLVCLGYPFHPPGRPEQLRTEHLFKLRCPTLIVQGERDPFGNRAEVEALKLSRKIAFAWMDDGDHDFGPRGRSGFTRKANLAAAADAVAAFVAKRSEAR